MPAGLTNATKVAAGFDHTIALREDGTVVSWGDAGSAANSVPTNLAGVKAITAGWNHNVALHTNGSLTAWGVNGASLGWNLTTIPASATNISAISAGSLHTIALRENGTVVSWGYNAQGQTNVPSNLTNIVAVAAGGSHSMALKENGTVIAWGENTLGQTNVPAGLSNVMAIAAGWRHSVALKNDGTVVCWGSNNNGQTNVSSTSLPVKMIAAGGDHTLAAMYSPFVQYPVDVTKDLLLIYNTNSAASEWVKDYYLARRPMVSGANVLGVYYNTNEWPAYPGRGLTSDVNFTNQVLLPYLNWLNQNPTKRPQYIIWFYDLPVQVYTNLSPSYYLHTIAPGIKPFVTCINMRTTNDCKAYIDKLAAFGTNYSPGKLFISASKGGYGNTNYYFDDAGLFAFELTNAVTGVLENGNPTSSVHYTSGTYSQHFFTATNVAGYASWGQHGSFVPSFTTNGTVSFFGGSSWYLMMTIESYNGHRDNPSTGQSNFLDWYSQQAFGGANYENTPIGAVTHVDEPGPGWNNPRIYFGRWAAGRSFSDCAWNSRETAFFQAVGDPFVRK